MVAVDNDSLGFFAKDYLLGRLRPSEKLRLQPLNLHQHAQQRGDYILARENQN